MFTFKNKSGFEFSIKKDHMESLVARWEYLASDFTSDEAKVEAKEGETEDLSDLRAQYLEAKGKKVPNQYTNNKEWIISKL